MAKPTSANVRFPMRARARKPAKPSAKKAKAAELLAAGVKQTDIAEVLGVSTRQVRRYREDPAVQDRIGELVERHKAVIDKLFATMLAKIGEGFSANYVNGFGQQTKAPDHRARSAAVKNMQSLAATLRPKVDKKQRRGVTYSELLEMYATYTAEGSQEEYIH